ncbi:MAG: hypothetical protein H6712_22145 [Myxococcales bacterium]|nr:hypothetical protein [Myxococcales bacterium]MCB9716576.1 hypothetical protein [Myxococcales bacterium]
MALICFSGINTQGEHETSVQICLGTEGGGSAEHAPYFFTVTIAGPNVPGPGTGPSKGNPGDAQRHRLPLSSRDMKNLRRWIEQVVPPDDQ